MIRFPGGASWLFFLSVAAPSTLNADETESTSELPLDCLRSTKTVNMEELDFQSCRGDPSNYDSNEILKSLSNILEINDVNIKFIGCKNYQYEIRYSSTPPAKATIYYPIRGNLEISSKDLVALAHELGHVAQLKQAGTQAALHSAIGEWETEVGADFLAGFSLAPLGVTVTQHSASDDLAGLYVSNFDDHGTPDTRTFAFRIGFYLSDRERERSAGELHIRFQTVMLKEWETEYGSVYQPESPRASTENGDHPNRSGL